MAKITPETARKIFLGVLIAVVMFIVAASIFSSVTRKKTHLTINTSPTGAAFELNGKDYTTPVAIKKVKEGSYNVTFSKEGYLVRKEKMEAVLDSENKYTFRLYTSDTKPSSLLYDLVLVAQYSDPIKEFILKMPIKKEHFMVEYKMVNREFRFVITRLAIFNKSQGAAGYNNQLLEYKKEASEWLRDQGFSAEELNILWEPPTAEKL